MGWSSFKAKIKKWRIGDFVRQFSIVTAGVMVTFIGSSLITSRSTEKQIKSSIDLIIKELEKSKEEIKIIRYKYEKDRTIAQQLIDSNFKVDNFHADTLLKYKTIFSQISSFAYSSDALEVLKTSSLMQAIEDKNLLLRIIETYKILGQVKEGVGEYYDLKKSVFIPLVLESNTATAAGVGDIYTTYRYMLSQNSMISFCRIATNFLDSGYFDDRIVDIDSTITMLRATYQ